MSFSVIFNEHELNEFLDVTDLRRGVGSPRTNNFQRMGSSQLQRYLGHTKDNAVWEMDFKVKHDLINKRRELADMLDVDEPKALIFGDEPDKYAMAVPEGDIPLEEQVFLGKGTIQWIVINGKSYSIDAKQFPFVDDEVTVENKGTDVAPLDIHTTFTSDADSIGFVSEDHIVQLGTAYSEDEENFVPSNKIINDYMGGQQKKHWRENVGRVRWRADSGDNTSQIMGSIDWSDKKSAANVKTFGPIDKTKPGFWHGPTITRFLTNELPNFEAFHRFQFKPVDGYYGKKGAQGLIEINYADADSNFVMGFEMKDNIDKKQEITYSFFIGTTRIIEMKLPNKIATEAGGFYGSIEMTKIGNKFTFKLARLRGAQLRETWSVTKTYYNETVAMLNASRIDCFMSQWKNFTTMKLGLTHTRLTQINTEDDTMVPLTFYEGDELFVEGTTNRVYINGIRNDNYRVIGSSQFLEAPKGKSEYSVLTDGTYNGYLEMRERYL